MSLILRDIFYMSLMWGTKTSSTQDENNMLDLVEIWNFLKNLTTLIFLVGLFYRWGKGLKSRNDEKHGKIVFSHNLYQSNHNPPQASSIPLVRTPTFILLMLQYSLYSSNLYKDMFNFIKKIYNFLLFQSF